MANPANTANLTVTGTDANGVTSANRSTGNVIYNPASAAVNFNLNGQITGTTALPTVGAVQNIYVKHAGAAGTITITAKINGGALQTLAVLQPGSFFCVWQSGSAGVAASSYDTISLAASAGTIAVEYFLGV